jgi:hypothetical protein
LNLTEEILEKKYREFVWIFLEKTTYFVIYALKDLNEILKTNYGEEQIELINPLTNIKSSKNSISEIMENQSIKKICKAVEFYQKLLSCEIQLNNSVITHSKIKGESVKSVKSNLSNSGITINRKIQQEWGGSNWNICFYTDKYESEYIYCEEIGNFEMKFLFKESNKS